MSDDRESLSPAQQISLFSTTALIVGCLIGSGIFVVTGPLTADVGPGLYIGYLIALVPAVGMGLTFAQLGSAMPTTATIYTLLNAPRSSAGRVSVGLGICDCRHGNYGIGCTRIFELPLTADPGIEP